jgi:VIT1/CCC1 family predicted Fe2+/Mn2+ transporter
VVRQRGYSAGAGDRWLRTSVLWVVAAQSLFLVFLTVFLFNHANPKSDGMEMVGVGAAFMFIFLPLSLPAFVLAKEWRYLVVAAVLAGLAAFAYFAIWFELLDELGIMAAPWSWRATV